MGRDSGVLAAGAMAGQRRPSGPRRPRRPGPPLLPDGRQRGRLMAVLLVVIAVREMLGAVASAVRWVCRRRARLLVAGVVVAVTVLAFARPVHAAPVPRLPGIPSPCDLAPS